MAKKTNLETDYSVELEREYQNKVVKLIKEKLEYKYLGNLQYAKGKYVNKKGLKNSPIIEEELRNYLTRAGYTEMQVTGAVEDLKNATHMPDKEFATLKKVNNHVYELLKNGVSKKPSLEENEQDVMFFDFEKIEKNRFAIAEEVSFNEPGGYSARPDLVVYVNGIALCVIELKRGSVDVNEGVRQHLSNQQRDLIPSFFTTTQFTVAAHESIHRELNEGEQVDDSMYGFKYATIGTPQSFWCPWKEDTNKTGIVLSDTESFLKFFAKETFMFLVRYCVVSDGGVKKVARPHQYHALRAAEPRLKDKASGVIWHSQGSGKSLTMVWLASYIRANFEDPRVLVITDRTELDKQLSLDFTDTGNNLHRATSQDDLIKNLKEGKEWLICTLIHKFGLHSDEDKESENDDEEKQKSRSSRRTLNIPLDKYLKELLDGIHTKYGQDFKAKGKNIFIFIDECHRTQGGLLHEAMRAIMGQDVMLIGFTGTPLLKEEKQSGYNAYKNMSEVRFGPFIHKYLHKQAVEDHVILDLQYEAREVEQYISSKEKLDEQLEKSIAGLTDERKQLIKDRWATLEHVYSAKKRIERIGWSILDDVQNHPVLSRDWANAFLVAGNIYSAYRYYDFFQSDTSCLKNRGAVVTRYSPSEYDVRKNTVDMNKQTEERYKYETALKSFAQAGVNTVEQYEEWAKERFVKQPGLMKLVIVVDKLLTGFDAPCASVLYIDKDMRDHNLFQAICRVNRLGVDVKDSEGNITTQTHKEFGLIVDFKQLFGNIHDAVTRFNDENGGFGGLDSVDIEGLLEDSISKNKKLLISAEKAYSALKGVWENEGLTDKEALADYYTKNEGQEDIATQRRDTLNKVPGAQVTAYVDLDNYLAHAGFSEQEALNYEHLAKEASLINLFIKQASGDAFDIRYYDPDMRALLDRYLEASEAEVIVSADADFSFLDLIDENSDAQDTADKTKKKAKGNDKAAADVIAAKARAVINNSKDSDPALYAKFSERLQELIDKLKNHAIEVTEYITSLVLLIKEAKSGGTNFPKGIATPIEKALWNNREYCGFSGDDEETIHQITKVQDMVTRDARPNFRDPTSRHGVSFRMALKDAFPSLSEEQIANLYTLIINN